jgi:quinol monooxygenase YgiN
MVLKKELLANAEESRREEGCLHYEFHCGLDVRNLFVLYETWSSRGALKAHFEMPYMKELAARRHELIEQYKMDILQRIV